MSRALNGERDPLERPWVRRSLQEDLAKSGLSQTVLATKYGVTQPAITHFKKRHKRAIDEIRNNAADEFAGILLAKQVNRIEALAEIVEGFAESADPKAARLAVQAMRNIAEELGHLPGRVTLAGEVGTTTRYVIDDVNPEDLT